MTIEHIINLPCSAYNLLVDELQRQYYTDYTVNHIPPRYDPCRWGDINSSILPPSNQQCIILAIQKRGCCKLSGGDVANSAIL